MDDSSRVTLEYQREITKNLNYGTIANARANLLLRGDQISLFFGHETFKSNKKDLSVDSMFIASLYNRRKYSQVKSCNFLRGRKWSADYCSISFAVPVFSSKFETNFNKIGHWVTGIYIRETNEMHYIDPYGSASVLPHVKDMLIHGVNTIGPEVTKLSPIFVFHAGVNDHNRQPLNDGESCGYFNCFFKKQFSRFGINGLYNPHFDLEDFKKHVIETIHSLLPPQDDTHINDLCDGEEIIEPPPPKKAKLIPVTPTVALNSLTLKTPVVKAKRVEKTKKDEIDISFVPDNLKRTPQKKKPKPKSPTVSPTIELNNLSDVDELNSKGKKLKGPTGRPRKKKRESNAIQHNLATKNDMQNKNVGSDNSENIASADFENITTTVNETPSFGLSSLTLETPKNRDNNSVITVENVQETPKKRGRPKRTTSENTVKSDLNETPTKIVKVTITNKKGSPPKRVVLKSPTNSDEKAKDDTETKNVSEVTTEVSKGDLNSDTTNTVQKVIPRKGGRPPKRSANISTFNKKRKSGVAEVLEGERIINNPSDESDTSTNNEKSKKRKVLFAKRKIPQSEDCTITVEENNESTFVNFTGGLNDLNNLTESQKLMPPPNILQFVENNKDKFTESEDNISESGTETDTSNSEPKKKRGRPKKVKDPEIILTSRRQSDGSRTSKNINEVSENVSEPVRIRRSERLAKQLPKLTPIDGYCHREGMVHEGGCAAISVNHKVDSADVGNFEHPCPHCGALLLSHEINTPSLANKCCSNGAVHTKFMQEKYDLLQNQIPAALKQYYEYNHPNKKDIEKNPILINSKISFGTVSTDPVPPLPSLGPPVKRLNGNIVHNGSGLFPPDGKDPTCGQIYVLDLEDAKEVLTKTAEKSKICELLIQDLHKVIRENHVFAPLYKNGADIITEAVEKANKEGKEIPRFRLCIVDVREEKNFQKTDPNIHPHCAEKPRNELVGMIWCNDDGEPPEYKGVWLDGKNGEITHVPYWSPNVDPLCYALLFPHGNQMYNDGIELNKAINEKTKKPKKNLINDEADENMSDAEVERHINGSDDEEEGESEDFGNGNKRKYASRKQFYRYHMFPREEKNRKTDFKKLHWLWSKGVLADAYLMDILCRTERLQMNQAKQKIEEMKKRYTTRAELRKYVENTYLPKGSKLGKLFTIPSSFKGGRKYMQKAYADIMTIIENTDLPSWFITFTGNPNWKEIQENIDKGANRADVKCRVFMAKAQKFLDDLFKQNVFGKVRAYHIVMEWQKRGMSHLHVILIMDKKVGVDEVDNYVSARIPDFPDPKDHSDAAEQQRELFEIITKNNIHLCNENSGCQINGVCTKGYKKPYSQSTVIHSHKPAEYQRLPPKSDKSVGKQSEKGAESVAKDKNTSEKIADKVITEAENDATDEFFDDFFEDYFKENEEDNTEEFFDYLDEVRKDLDIDQVEYKRLPPPPKGAEITEEIEHLYGNIYEMKIKGGAKVEIDDGHVVPYNPFLSLKYKCHINVECTVGQTASPKYTCKYTTKLGEVIYAKGYKLKDKENESDPDVIDFDEAEQHILARIMTACEAWMRLNNTWIIKQSHIVETLYVHLENEHSVYFNEGNEEKAAETKDKSQLLGFFKLCEKDAEARNYTFGEIALHYRYLKKEGVWIKRIRNPQKFFVRVHHVPPREVELYALRVLLMNVKGPTSFRNLKTVGDEECLTFVAAAQKLGLWESDEIHFKVIEEAIREMRSARQQKHFLAMVIAHNRPSNADKFVDHFLNTIFLPYGMLPTENIEQRKHKALCYLEYIFQKMDTSCRRLGLTVPDTFENDYDSTEAERDFEESDNLMLDGRKVTPQVYAEAQRAKLEKSEDQINAFNHVWDTVVNQTGEFMMLQGEGGAGKTFVYNTLIDYCIANGKKVIACASTGIAATLLKRGMTAHSAFCIPKELDHESPPRIGGETKKGQLIASADLIIIDEVSMLHKDVLKFIDRTLRDLKDKTKLFGGAAVLIGGDWKQLTPVVPKAQPPKIIEASVKNWEEFKNVTQLNLTKNMRVDPNELQFVELLKLIGNGDKSVYLPGTDCTIAIDPENAAKNVSELINFCFEKEWLENPEENIENLCGSAILCPTNTVVQKVNNDLLNCLVGDEKVYLSRDTPYWDNVVNPMDDNLDDYSIEAMHKIETAGMPPHELKVKKGAIVMLIKNLSVFTGLCNGTRMQVVDFTDEFLKCKVLSGPRSRANELIYLPRCKFEYGGCLSEPGVQFTRTQFPVKLSFAISINKAQGQTLNRVGLLFCHGKECFSHGQLYTAMSRVRTKASLKILPAEPIKLTTKNIVFHQLLN